MSEHLNEVQAQIDALTKEAREKSSELFTNGAKTLFEQYPMVESVHWTQYTPYFNDGEECTFSAYCPNRDSEWGDLLFNGSEYEGDELDEAWRAKSKETRSVAKPNPNYDPNADWRAPYNVRSKEIYVDEPNPDYDPAYTEAEKAFIEFFKHFPEDMFKSLFGDHAQCTLTIKGVEVEHAEHD
jgi:hypothetical protein